MRVNLLAMIKSETAHICYARYIITPEQIELDTVEGPSCSGFEAVQIYSKT